MPVLPFQFVCVVGPSDLPLLRQSLASLALAVDGGGNTGVVWLFVDDDDAAQVRRLGSDMPVATALDIRLRPKSVFRDHLSGDGYVDQMRIKLLAGGLVETAYYNVVDADFLFIRPVDPEVLFHEGRSIYRIGPWEEDAEATRKWRPGSERVVAGPVDCCGMIAPPYILCRDVVRRFLASDSFLRFKEAGREASEYVTYAAFARSTAPRAHAWVAGSWTGELPLLNQNAMGGPPRLDETIRLDDYLDRAGIVFWSHWDEAEPLMRRFCVRLHELAGRDASRLRPAIRRDVAWSTFEQLGLRATHAVWSDGWVHKESCFRLVDMPFWKRTVSFDVIADWPNTVEVVTHRGHDRIPIAVGRQKVSVRLPFRPSRRTDVRLRFVEARKEPATGRNLYLRAA